MKSRFLKRTVAVMMSVFMILTFSTPAGLAAEGPVPGTPLTDISEGFAIEPGPDDVFTYTGEAIEPSFTVSDTRVPEGPSPLPEESYTAVFTDNTEPGTALLTVTGKEDAGYTGTLTWEFTIEKADLSGAEVTLSSSSFMYTGKAIRPEARVVLGGRALEAGKDYTAAYTDCIYPGDPKVIITGKGGYEGSVTRDYRIRIPSTRHNGISNPKENTMRVAWGKVPGSTGYLIYKSTSRNSGYRMVRNLKYGYTSWIDRNCPPGKTYYYRMRTYRIIDGRYYYGSLTPPASKDSLVPAPSSVKAGFTSEGKVKVSWSSVPSAGGYIIYRSTCPDRDFTEAGRTEAGVTSFDDTVTGGTFYYRVASISSDPSMTCLQSAAVSTGEKLAATSFDTSRIKKYKTSVLLAWNSVKGASGYEIYRLDPVKNRYVYRGRVTSGSVTTWTDTGITFGKNYFYKVRPYAVSHGFKRYGDFSYRYMKQAYGWVYSGSYKLYYNKSGYLVKDLRNILGKRVSYVIKVNKYRNVVTVYTNDGSRGFIIPVVSFTCSTGKSTPSGTFYTPVKYRWRALVGPCWGQWCTRINGPYLFHSLGYDKKNNRTMPAADYNKLGTTASHGCVRLRAGDAKWIYDNCRLKTKVVMYSSNVSGPYGKPVYDKLPSWHRWDPTDPFARSSCMKNHCHGY